MALTLIRKDLIRTAQNATDENDVDQLSGADLLLEQNGTTSGNSAKRISDLKLTTNGNGAALIGVEAVNGVTGPTLQAALEALATSGGLLKGIFASVATLPAAGNTNGDVAIVYNTGDHTEDGVYEYQGAWQLRNATIVWDSGNSEYDFAAAINMNNNVLRGLPSPTAGDEAASKTYVDALIAGYVWNTPVDYKADIVVATYAGLPATNADNANAYAFVIGDDSGNGHLYQADGSGAWPAQNTAVSPANGALLMLNDSSDGDVGAIDYILEYQAAADNWDYDDTNSRRHVPSTNETRIYKVDDNAYTYNTQASSYGWVLADSSGGKIGDRIYTENRFIIDGETVTLSLDKLDIELFDLYEAVGLTAVQGLADIAYAENNVLADAEALITSLNKLDLKWGDLASTALGEGAALVGIHDVGNIITATNVEDALQEIAGRLDKDDIKGWSGYKQDSDATLGDTVTAGLLSFEDGLPTVRIATGNFAGIDAFFGAPTSNITFGTGTAGNFSAVNDAFAAGFEIQVEVDGTVQPFIQAVYDFTNDRLDITLDGTLKSKDFIMVRLKRVAYSA